MVALSCSKKVIGIIKRNNILKSHRDFCLNCLHSFRTRNKLESHKNIWENKSFSSVILTSEDTKILEFNQYQKSDKASLIIYADLE